MVTETGWVKVHSQKISPLLTDVIDNVYRLAGWVPSLLHRPVRSLRGAYHKVPVVVQVNPDHWVAALNTDNLGGVMGCEIRHRLGFIDCFSTAVNIKTLREMVAHEAVLYVWHDREISALLDTAMPVVNIPPVWTGGYRGKGIGIAILDSGIYPHPDLTTPHNRIIGFKDFVNGRTQPYDDNGHGTHCAGDAAGNGNKSGGKYRGAAPEANLIGVKVLNNRGSGLMSDLLAGVQWCINNKEKYGIKVLSLSLGGKATTSYKKDPLCLAVEKAWQSGIVVCAAAGNEGPGLRTIASPGIDPKVITIGAADNKNSTDPAKSSVARFSSRGPTIDGLTRPDVVAPGVGIISLRALRSFLDKTGRLQRIGQWYVSMSGTSMATPICAGIAAVLMESCPRLTPDSLKTLLISTCRNLGTDSNSQGAGLVDALAALRKCQAGSPTANDTK